jgi:PAS domain S-box-containing protein
MLQQGDSSLPTNEEKADENNGGPQSPHAGKSARELIAIIDQQDRQLSNLHTHIHKANVIRSSLEQAADIADLGHAIWDDQLDRDIYVSDVMAKIHGMDVATYLEKISSLEAYALLVVEEDREAYLAYESQVEHQSAHSDSFVEYRVRIPNGQIRHLKQQTRLLPTEEGIGPQYLIVMQDLTKARQAEEGLLKGQEALSNSVALLRLSAKIANIGHAIWNYDLNTYSEVSEEWAGIFGYEQSEFLNKFATFEADLELVDPADRQRYLDYYNSEEDLDIEYKIVRRDGEIRHVYQLYHYDGANPSQAFITLQDITERKRTEANLIQSSKMITLGEMAAGMAHELNQPLNAINIAAENISQQAARGRADVPDHILKKIDRIKEQVFRASSITDQMRIFGREAKEKSYAFDLKDAVNNVVELMEPQLKLDEIKISVELIANQIMIWGHQIRLEQVLLNLVSNANFAIKSGGKIQKMLSIAVSQESESWVTLSVSDTGAGIPEGALKRIFEPFYTTKDVGVGTGLGLSVSFGIVHDMGGNMIAENTAQGARISVELPIIKA